MRLFGARSFRVGILGALMCSGCAVPHFDVPTDSAGQPTVRTIVERIQCELRDMVRDDRPEDVASFHRLFLLNGDYDVEIALSLEVNDTGGLSPALSYMNAISGGTFTFAVNGTLSESRDHNFTENLQYSLRSIYLDWKTNANAHDCPEPDTNLAGTLGIKDFVAMAVLSQGLDETKKLSDTGGVFGGTIKFLVTKQLGTFGPTWSLVNFTGPGALATVSEVNTDQITLAFAQGPNVGKRMLVTRHFNPIAHSFLQQLLTGSISSQLNSLQNRLR